MTRKGLILPSQTLECNAKIVVGVGVIGLDGQGLAVAGAGLFQTPRYTVCVAKVKVSLGETGIDSKGLVIAIDSPVYCPLVQQRVAKVVVGFGKIWFQGDGPLQLHSCLIQFTHPQVVTAQIIKSVRVIGVDFQGAPVTCLGLDRPAKFPKGITEVVVRLGEIRLDGDGLGYQIDGNIVFPHLIGDCTKQMQGIDLIGMRLQYLSINTFSL